jgi:hypothetical protein
LTQGACHPLFESGKSLLVEHLEIAISHVQRDENDHLCGNQHKNREDR